MALSEYKHHTSRTLCRGPGRGTRSTTRPRSGATHLPNGGTEYFSLDVEDVQGQSWTLGRSRVLQHTVEHADAICPFVQILDDLVPQLGEQLVHFFTSLDTQLPVEQVIDVPKVSEDIIQPRLVDRKLRYPQIVDSWWKCPPLHSNSRLPSIPSSTK